MIYNDNEWFACAWLRELIEDGHLPHGEISNTPIQDLTPDRCHDTTHLFAGIGGWPLALRMAGWPEDVPVWTGSCPCQPFSSAGKGRGTDDERHLWPFMARLVAEREPPIVFGEQVASKDGREWLGGVRADMEAMGYAFGAADLCAACVGAPHSRQRLFWVAHRVGGRVRGEPGNGVCATIKTQGEARQRERGRDNAWPGSPVCLGLGNANCEGRSSELPIQTRIVPACGHNCGLVRCVEPTKDGGTREVFRRAPLEPSLFPLADGVPNRMGLLRGAGNAIVPQVAAVFIECVMDELGLGVGRVTSTT